MSNFPNIRAMLRVLAGQVTEPLPDDIQPGEFVRAVQAEAGRQADQARARLGNATSWSKFPIRNTNPPQNRSQRP